MTNGRGTSRTYCQDPAATVSYTRDLFSEHGIAACSGAGSVAIWLNDRLNGVPVPTGCHNRPATYHRPMSATAMRIGVLSAMAVTVITGCSSDDQNDSPAPTPMGRTFISTAVEGQPIPGGGPLTLSFADGRISAHSGCNTTSGTVEFTDRTLHVGDLASTLMGCPGERGQADAWQQNLLHSEPTWALDDAKLTLTATDMTVELLDKEIAQPDKPVVGTSWTVSALLTPEAQISSRTIDEVKPNLTIAEDGAVSGSAGCNRLIGSATVAESEITFELGTTKMLCSPEVMEVESAVLKALDGKTTATVDADTLTLRNDNGNGLLLRAG